MPLGKRDKKSSSRGSSSSAGSFARPKDDAAALRARQVDSLRQYFSTMRTVQDDAVYEVPLTLPSRRQIRLVIQLAPDFPRSPPQLSLPGEAHRLLDAQGRVMPTAHQNLGKWTAHSALGRTVYEIVQLFMKQPPEPAPQPHTSPAAAAGSASASASASASPAAGAAPPRPPHSSSSSSSSSASSSAASSRQSSRLAGDSTGLPPQMRVQQQQQQHAPSLHRGGSSAGAAAGGASPSASGGSWRGDGGAIPQSFPELHQKTPAELQQLLSDEVAFQIFFDQLAAVQTMKRVRDDLTRANEELAQRNIGLEAEIEMLSRSIGAAGSSADAKKREYEEKVRRQQEVMKRFSTPALVEQLGEAAEEADEQAEAIADDFLQGDLAHRDFVKQFLAAKTQYHLRSAKKESLTMMTSGR